MPSGNYSLSICIPVFRQDVRNLVNQLSEQVDNVNIPVEILIADDGSPEEFMVINRDCANKRNILFFGNTINVGRAAIRNFLAKHSKGSHLLFLDGDSSIELSDFLSKYIECINTNPDAVWCGGTYFPIHKADSVHSLHFRYGNQVVARLHSHQDKNGRFFFMSSNFMIPSQVFMAIGFDENIRNYGHEDTLFGCRLEQNLIPVLSVQNAVMHDDLDTNGVFIHKTEQSVRNLRSLISLPQYKDCLQKTSLVKSFLFLGKWRLAGLYRIFFGMIIPLVLHNLRGAKPSLNLLQAYKLYLMVNHGHEDRV